jgi:hypothetical protein
MQELLLDCMASNLTSAAVQTDSLLDELSLCLLGKSVAPSAAVQADVLPVVLLFTGCTIL